MSLLDMTDEAIVASLLVEEIRRLDENVRKERALKHEVIARYERTTADKRELETRVALLEAEARRLKEELRKLSPFQGISPTASMCPVETARSMGDIPARKP